LARIGPAPVNARIANPIGMNALIRYDELEQRREPNNGCDAGERHAERADAGA
jgi:hypothetical protein